MKEMSRRTESDPKKSRTSQGTAGEGTMCADSSGHRSSLRHQRLVTDTTQRRYSYVWETLDEDTLTRMCAGIHSSSQERKSARFEVDLPEVILVIDEQCETQSTSRKTATAYVET